MAGKTAITSIERLKVQLQVPDEVHAGTCIKMGWCKGKQVTEAEYATAVKAFRTASAERSINA